jgi:hypothetical protein
MTVTFWFFRLPEEMPIVLASRVKNESDARAHIRRRLGLKRLPQKIDIWSEIFDGNVANWPDIRGSECDRFVGRLKEMGCRFKIWGRRELTVLVGPIEFRFDLHGDFLQMTWHDEKGEHNVVCRGE